MSTAEELRLKFKQLPAEAREANQCFSIRVWRALSWLERAETLDLTDYEGRFISAWIAFNALYGQLDEGHRPWGEREAWGAFLSRIWKLDHDKRIDHFLGKRELQVLKLIETRFLSREFWERGESAVPKIKQELRSAILDIQSPKRFSVLKLLVERLYVMRLQVFHGASTKGSFLNRRTLQNSGNLLIELLPTMIANMIDYGVEEDWGSVCFPPTDQPRR